jgi:5-guanidino-2-oxopentanoate decarboxylase
MTKRLGGLMTEMTGGEALVAALEQHGVELVFGIPGTHNLPVYDALLRSSIRHISMRHEQGLGYAADGYARRSGKPGVVLTTAGPAVLNAAAAAAQAWSDSSPMLLISPGMPLGHPVASTGYLHELPDAAAALRGAMGRSLRVSTHAELVHEVNAAFTAFTASRPRPVHIEIPLDLLAAEAAVELASAVRVCRPAPAPEPVAADAQLLAGASRVAIVAGGGSWGAVDELAAVAHRLGAGVTTTTNGKGVFEAADPLSLGSSLGLESVHDWFAVAEVVLAVGTELAESDTWTKLPAPAGKLIRIDIDPLQAHSNFNADVAVIADAKLALAALDEALAGIALTAADDTFLEAAQAAAAAQAVEVGGRWKPWMDALRAALPATATIAADNAMACYCGAVSCLPLGPAERFIFPTGVGTLGFAVPVGVGAMLADPPGPVVALSGDGGLMFTLAELASAAQLRLGLPVIVFINNGYGEIRREMIAAGSQPLAVDFPAPDFAALAQGLGCHSAQLDSPQQLAGVLEAALARHAPTVIAIQETPAAA